MTTLESFTQQINGWSNLYSSYILIGKNLTIKQVVNTLNNLEITLKDKFCVVGNGTIENLQDDWKVICFDIGKGSPHIINNLSYVLNCIGYAYDWDSNYLVAVENGHMLNNFTATWNEGMPCINDNVTFDAFITIKDNASGYTFEAGSGACDKETKKYYENLVNSHPAKTDKYTYRVKFKVEAKYVAEVKAENQVEALEIAKSEFSDADFGEASDIDGIIISVEDC